MKFAHAAFHILDINPFATDWALGVLLIVLTVFIHVAGLGLISQSAVHIFSGLIWRPHARAMFVALTCAATLSVTCLLGIEAAIWAAAYWLLGALPDFRSSVLYSLNAMTSYGHTNLHLEDRWQLMGALEALNGWLLLGLTTAFLFAAIQKAWLSGSRGGRQ